MQPIVCHKSTVVLVLGAVLLVATLVATPAHAEDQVEEESKETPAAVATTKAQPDDFKTYKRLIPADVLRGECMRLRQVQHASGAPVEIVNREKCVRFKIPSFALTAKIANYLELLGITWNGHSRTPFPHLHVRIVSHYKILADLRSGSNQFFY